MFAGYVPAPQHLRYTQHCNVGIASYDTSSLNNVFCAPNKVYEYARYGIPMLCSENISLEETVGRFGAGLCLEFSDEMEIVKAIHEIIDNYSDYQNKAKSFYESVNIKEMIKEVIFQ